MIRLPLGLVLASATTTAAIAQQPEPTPTAPSQSRAGEIRIGFVAQSLRRQSAFDAGGTATGVGSLSGFELFARLEGVGLLARRSTGTIDANGHGLEGEYLLREVRLIIGPRVFSIEGGRLQRTGSYLNVEAAPTAWRGGIRSQWSIGGSGVVVTIGAGALFSKLDTEGGAQFKLRGHDLDAQALLQAPGHLPLYVLAGWRYERFDDLEASSARSEEASGPYLGIGVRLAPRAILRDP